MGILAGKTQQDGTTWATLAILAHCSIELAAETARNEGCPDDWCEALTHSWTQCPTRQRTVVALRFAIRSAERRHQSESNWVAQAPLELCAEQRAILSLSNEQLRQSLGQAESEVTCPP